MFLFNVQEDQGWDLGDLPRAMGEVRRADARTHMDWVGGLGLAFHCSHTV